MTLPRRCIACATSVSLICLWTAAAHAQDTAAGVAVSQSSSWLMTDIAAAARAEGTLTVYSSINEQEGLPLWKIFEEATGVKVNYVRSSDSIILSRVAIENRARQRSWDLAVTTTVNRLPDEVLLQFDPPQAAALIAQARDPNRRWYGVYANYNTPAYNTELVKTSQLPKSYEEFLERKEWSGKIALDDTDDEWLSAMIMHYGEERGRTLQAQQFLTKHGRMPTRPDVPVNPPDITDRLKDRKIIATIFSGEEQKKWQGLFKDIFKPK
jgi:hypothetical protein